VEKTASFFNIYDLVYFSVTSSCSLEDWSK